MKTSLFKEELNYITDIQIRKFTEVALESLPEYFFEVAASSTGKYHPSYALGTGGLVRHTKAAARFANYIMQLDQNQIRFSSRERDCAIAAIILHDGWKHGTGKSSFTVHDHPQICADWVATDKSFKEVLAEEDLRIIAGAIASHMGQWNTNKKSKIELPKPLTELQQIVHMCDYLASRKDIEVLFSETIAIEAPINIEEFVMPFGRHKGKLLIEVGKQNKEYLKWLQANVTLKHPLKEYVAQILQ